MESADVSFNARGIGDGPVGIDANKKASIGEHSELESGYVSNWSISHSHATASTSGLSNSAKLSSSSFKRSLDLETISENIEHHEAQETPTTRSIRHLNAFHINTPHNLRNQSETTPKKANYFSNLYESGLQSGGSEKKNRSQESGIRWSTSSSNKSSPKLRSSVDRMKSFTGRSTLFESIDENYENIFIDDAINACNQSIGVSPIKPHNTSNVIVQTSDKAPGLQRHASGIESSTPKTSFKRTRTQSIVKPKATLADELARSRLIRKTQSFSPAKRLALREIGVQQHLIEQNEVINEVTNEPYNPARKVLAFTDQKFDQLVQLEAPKTPSKSEHGNASSIADDIVVFSAKTPIAAKSSPLKRLDTQKNRSRLLKEFSRKKTLTRTATIATRASLNESDILASLASQNETDSSKLQTGSAAAVNATDDISLMDISDSAVSIIQTPSTNTNQESQAAVQSDTPMRDDLIKRNIRDEANRTPTKRFEKSISYNFPSIKTSPEKEKFDIIYGRLPCTPPKNRRAIKRPAGSIARTESPLISEPSAKRKLYQHHHQRSKICQRPMFHNGIERLDIPTQLSKLEMHNVIEQIFGYLPDKDLQAASSVCKSWKASIDGDRTLRTRRRKFIKTMQMAKENVVHRIEIKAKFINNNDIGPFRVHNKNTAKEKPVPVSPSTRRFNEHQQIIKNLQPEQRILRCPRCNGPSIVHPVTANETKALRKSPRRQPYQTQILQDRSLRSSVNSASKNRRNVTVVISEYATCSKKGCGAEFCTNCYCNRHVNAKCTKRPLGSSPKSDDDAPYRQEHRNTKRNLRRLGRLVF